jgi:hypothetical protein
MKLPPELAAIYSQALNYRDENSALIAELEVLAEIAEDYDFHRIPAGFAPAPSHCQLCGQSLQGIFGMGN